jgi:hypothetical protein
MDRRELLPTRSDAAQDQAFQAFLSVVLAANVEVSPHVRVWVRADVQADYLARGIFPEMTSREPVGSGPAKGVWGVVPEAVARAMLTDACDQAEQEKAKGNKRATKWSWLRNRLSRALARD